MTFEIFWPQKRVSIACPQCLSIMEVDNNSIICKNCKYQDFDNKDAPKWKPKKS